MEIWDRMQPAATKLSASRKQLHAGGIFRFEGASIRQPF
jgi:hypothetical protein